MIDTLWGAAYISQQAYNMGSTAFGEHLKREREMRGVSLEEISSATRISLRFLEALEREQWNLLPGGIFNRGFIRAIAHFLGLNEEDLIAEYALATDAPPEVAVLTTEAKPRRPWGAAVLLVVLLGAIAGGGWFAYERYAPLLKTWHHSFARAAAGPQPAQAQPSALPVLPAGRTHSTATVTQTPAAQSPANASAAKMPEKLELNVQAGKSAEVKIVADGKTVFSGTLSAEETEHFQARDSFEVFSSEASALLLELNGRIQPPLGPPGQPGSVKLTRKDLKKAQGGQD
jgi:cytoskeletal protein RodZ